MTGSITQLLACSGDSPPPKDELLPLIYDDLRAMARRQLARERAALTLCTTALVHEAYLRLVDDTQVSARGRSYFFAAAANAMRRILVEQARARGRLKRGGGLVFAVFDDQELATDDFLAQLIDLEAALERLEGLSPRQVRIVECRVFGGLDLAQTAQALDISERTVKRDWAVARAWLYRTLGQADEC